MSLHGSESVGALARLSGGRIDLDDIRRVLGDSNAFWQALFNVAGIGIVFGTMEGGIVAITPSIVDLFGYDEAEFKEIGPAGVTHPEDLETDVHLFHELIAGERDFYQLDKRYVRKDGSLMWGRLTIVLLRDENAEPRFITAMVEDITAEKQAREYEARLMEAHLYRRKALELNDEVLQGLVVSKLAFDSGDIDKGHIALSNSLARLKQVIDEMLASGEDMAPGDFVRANAIVIGRPDD